MNKIKFLIGVVFCLLLFNCSSNDQENIVNDGSGNTNGDENSGGDQDNNNGNTFKEWSIPVNEVFDGAGKDGIPSIDIPVFLSGNNTKIASYMNVGDLIIGIKIGSETKAYPHKILDWHEVLNDNFVGENITINYCPLTRTAFAWKNTNQGVKSTFGVSGLLYNTNLILYDRETDSHWSQMKLECVNGAQFGNKPDLVQITETTWEVWKTMYPETKILSDEQGFNRNYQNYPYGGYINSDDFLLFPVSPIDNRISKKERVHGVINEGSSKVYRFNSFIGGNVFKDEFKGSKLLVVGNENVIKSFILPLGLDTNTYSYSFNNSLSFFTDNLGNKWSINGEAIEGPLKGRKLTASKSVTGFWFSIASFYPNPEIY